MSKSPDTPQPQTPKMTSRSQRASRNKNEKTFEPITAIKIKKNVPGIAMPVGRQRNAKEREQNGHKESIRL
jgi:hypothetical protein